VWKRFRNNWVNPGYGGGDQQPGVWYDFQIGDVQFFMLDGRYYRNPKGTDDGPPSMLGPVQKAWLLDRLAKSSATFKVICSPVPFADEAKQSKDTWRGYPEERAQLFTFLTKNKIEGAMILSADRHRSDLWRLPREGDYPLYDLNSSRLTNQHVHGTIPQAVFSYNAKQSFGTVDFNTTTDDPTATYRIVNIDGEEVYNFDIKLSQLR
jgi:alkaline phosphatase D